MLLAGKAPGEHWYYAVLYLLLLCFIVLNTATLVHRFRSRGV